MVSGAQAENCSLQLDAERLGGFRGTGLAGERGAVAGVAAHLHVHDEPGAWRVLRQGRPREECSTGDADQKSRTVSFAKSSLTLGFRRPCGTAGSSGRRWSADLWRRSGIAKRAKKVARRCGSSTKR